MLITLPTTHNYLPTDNIENEKVPRITVYDAQVSRIPFEKHFSLEPIIKMLNSNVKKSLFSVILYFAPLLELNKNKVKMAQALVSKGLRWSADVYKAKSLTNMHGITKDFNIPL
ncbi:hypothetical protein PIROE2DRAFT_8193 [Piromyces sp. E2]|nr:hypothetical protein PIROE2DRAFT_8193 [Piromyces sp. E2]|eukprot:OUM64885.1 hypothetical protein PIROE2DRAFT_8193 [Piromyces sp. E2]